MSEGDTDISTANTMRERAGESRVKLWVVLRANRLVVTGVLAAAFFALFVLGGAAIDPSFRTTIRNANTLQWIFSTMLGGVLTSVTLIVTISQLVISQENGPLGDQRRRMSDAMDFREFTREMTGETTPSDPSAFLRLLIDETEDRAEQLNEMIQAGAVDEQLRAEMDEFTDSLVGNSETVRDQLEGARFGTFDVLFAALNFNYSWKIFHVERMKNEYEDSLTSDHRQQFDDLKASLSMFGPAREHIKTLYFEWALINLSQLIIYAAVPALLVAGAMMAFVSTGSFPGSTLGVSDVLWVTALAFTITLVPFFLFASYIIRVATVAKRTLAIGPLILRDSQR